MEITILNVLFCIIGCLACPIKVIDASAQLVSKSDSRLPMSLSSVINDLEAEGASKVTRACLVTSLGVTQAQKKELLKSIFNLDEFDISAFGMKGENSEDSLAVAHPSPQASASDVASTVVACGGMVIFAPSPVDLSRGEGLFDVFAPAIERLLAGGIKSSLIVLATDTEFARKQLNHAAASVLPNLVQKKENRNAKLLEDVFDSIEYVSTPGEVAAKLEAIDGCEPSTAAAAVAAEVDFFAPSFTSILSNKALAAARTLGPAARSALESATNDVQDKLKLSLLDKNFGDLCDVAVKKALQNIEISILSSGMAKQIRSQLQDELYSELGEIFDNQLELLRVVSFEDFRKRLSELRISPNLAQDMDGVVQKSIIEFNRAARNLIAKGAKTWSTVPARTAFSLQLNDFCRERLLVAKASGQYKTLPRKGVTFGLHWLLPKPFGNDFRQDPWMVHATNDMIYVPNDKITEVTATDVESGDWRDKVIPSPSTGGMLYREEYEES